MLENLKKLRENAKITQKQLAEAIGVSQQSINKYENHNIEPDIETLIRIADYFDTSVDDLIGHGQAVAEPNDTLSSDEKKLLSGYRRLTKPQQQAVLAVTRAFRPESH